MSKGSGGTRTARPIAKSIDAMSMDLMNDMMSLSKEALASRHVTNIESLNNIKDKKVRETVWRAISRYHTVLGVRQTNVMLADLPTFGTFGLHVTDDSTGKSDSIYLNKAIFMQSYGNVKGIMENMYREGTFSRTNKPVAHTIVHELAHATFNDKLNTPNAIAAREEFSQMYKKFIGDKKHNESYGLYARQKPNDFWSEVSVMAVYGPQDEYTKWLKATIKKYKL